ncbi:hypothetical protein PVAND_006649 [Polypedilum vanderplanki]|uniref:G-protein coupled receptors family 2 profile 2 domain-containing protein n=1 Tax=Polypedilum vanderplanki TaxID=319348 RepID=A0A9J6C4B0_POLVA|nr:hypothetical protein PVAND_006649 [Polypedilum vanderplanki]
MFLKIILNFSLLIHILNGSKINKCCAYDEVVYFETLDEINLTSKNIYKCVKLSADDSLLYNNYIDTNLTFPVVFMGFNIFNDAESHWPTCGENDDIKLSTYKLNDSIKISQLTSCIDMMDDVYYVFTCNDEKSNKISDLVDVYELKKCCSSGKSYDIFARKCVINNETDIDDDFRDLFFDKVVLFEYDVIKCNADDVLVEYHSQVHSLKMYENTLVITNLDGYGPEVFSHNSYCIESTINTYTEKPIEMSEEHFTKKYGSKFIAKVCRKKSICNQIPCIRKCCEIGERMTYENSTTNCEPHDTDIDVPFHSFKILENELELERIEPSEYGIMMPKYCLKFALEDTETHYISGIDGSLYLETDQGIYSNEEFCVDYFVEDSVENLKMKTFICFNDEDEKYQKMQFHVYAGLMTVSAFFLGVTFLVYIFLPKLLNLHGKTVVCHVIALFIGYSFLSIIQFNTEVMPPFCMLIAFIVYFGLFSAFSWLNVMCLDIYWTFGSVRASHSIRRTKEMKKFVYYSAYAWGVPFIMTIFTYMIDFYKVLPAKLQPNIGKSKCWFEEQSSPGHMIFFLFPIGIQISMNFILFILTAIHCNRIKAEIHRMQMCDNNDQSKRKSFIADKAIFVMNIKLFCVMGISWCLEIIATVYKQDSVWWHISDVFNCLQGVMVFIIFVCKKKVLMAFQKKLGFRSLHRPKASGSTTLSTLDLNSTSMSNRINGKLIKSNSSASNLN